MNILNSLKYKFYSNYQKNMNILFFMVVAFFILKKYMVIIFNDILNTDTILTTIPYILFIIIAFTKIYLSKVSNKEIILLLISLILYFLTNDKSLIIYGIIAIAAKNIEFNNIVKYYTYINLGLFLIIVISVGIGILPDVGEMSYRAGTHKIREDFGFINPNTPFFNLVPVYAGYIYLRYEKYNLLDRLILISTSIYIFIQTDSRTGFLSIILSIVFVEIIKKINISSNKYLRYCIVGIPLIFTLVSIVIGTIFAHNYRLNKLLSYRPVYWNEFLKDINILGFDYKELLSTHPLDNSYIYFLSVAGVLVCVIFIFILCYATNIAIEKRNEALIASLFLFLLYSLSENIIYDRPLNFPIVLAMIYVIDNINIDLLLEKIKLKKRV